MVGAHQGADAHVPAQGHLDPRRRRDGDEAEAHVDLPGRETRDHLGRRQHRHIEMDARVAAAELGDQGGQETEPHALDRGDAHAAGAQTAQHVELGHRGLQRRRDPAGVAEQDLAGGGELQAAGLALEQLEAQSVLHLADLARDGRGGDVEPPRRLADREMFGGGVEIDQRRLVEDPGQQRGRKRVLARAGVVLRLGGFGLGFARIDGHGWESRWCCRFGIIAISY